MIVFTQAKKTSTGYQPLFMSAEDAHLGAIEHGYHPKYFARGEVLPKEAMVVGSVEVVREHLEHHNIPVPTILITNLEEKYGPVMAIHDFDDLEDEHFPLFIKPADSIKGFTGFVARDKKNAPLYMEGYEGRVLCKEVVNYYSEWRCYVQDGRILNVSHYQGDPLIFPNPAIINRVLKDSDIPHCCYTLDVGVTENRTLLIETNDAWAIGNYGLHPYDYFTFLRKRWNELVNQPK